MEPVWLLKPKGIEKDERPASKVKAISPKSHSFLRWQLFSLGVSKDELVRILYFKYCLDVVSGSHACTFNLQKRQLLSTNLYHNHPQESYCFGKGPCHIKSESKGNSAGFFSSSFLVNKGRLSW